MLDATKLKIILAEKQLHQADLIRLTGLSPYTISRTLAGHSTPNTATVGKIAQALEIPVGLIIKTEKR